MSNEEAPKKIPVKLTPQQIKEAKRVLAAKKAAASTSPLSPTPEAPVVPPAPAPESVATSNKQFAENTEAGSRQKSEQNSNGEVFEVGELVWLRGLPTLEGIPYTQVKILNFYPDGLKATVRRPIFTNSQSASIDNLSHEKPGTKEEEPLIPAFSRRERRGFFDETPVTPATPVETAQEQREDTVLADLLDPEKKLYFDGKKVQEMLGDEPTKEKTVFNDDKGIRLYSFDNYKKNFYLKSWKINEVTFEYPLGELSKKIEKDGTYEIYTKFSYYLDFNIELSTEHYTAKDDLIMITNTQTGEVLKKFDADSDPELRKRLSRTIKVNGIDKKLSELLNKYGNGTVYLSKNETKTYKQGNLLKWNKENGDIVNYFDQTEENYEIKHQNGKSEEYHQDEIRYYEPDGSGYAVDRKTNKILRRFDIHGQKIPLTKEEEMGGEEEGHEEKGEELGDNPETRTETMANTKEQIDTAKDLYENELKIGDFVIDRNTGEKFEILSFKDNKNFSTKVLLKNEQGKTKEFFAFYLIKVTEFEEEKLKDAEGKKIEIGTRVYYNEYNPKKTPIKITGEILYFVPMGNNNKIMAVLKMEEKSNIKLRNLRSLHIESKHNEENGARNKKDDTTRGQEGWKNGNKIVEKLKEKRARLIKKRKLLQDIIKLEEEIDELKTKLVNTSWYEVWKKSKSTQEKEIIEKTYRLNKIKIEKDKIDNPFRWFLISKINDQMFSTIYGSTKDEVSMEKIEKAMPVDSENQPYYTRFAFVSKKNLYNVKFSSNGWILSLENEEEIKAEGKRFEDIKNNPRAKFAISNPEESIIRNYLSFQDGEYLLTNLALEDFKQKKKEFEQNQEA